MYSTGSLWLGQSTEGLDRGGHAAHLALEKVLAQQFGIGQLDRVDTVKAGATQLVLGLVTRLNQLVERDIGERVGADRFADLFGRQTVAMSSARVAKSMP